MDHRWKKSEENEGHHVLNERTCGEYRTEGSGD